MFDVKIHPFLTIASKLIIYFTNKYANGFKCLEIRKNKLTRKLKELFFYEPKAEEYD